VNEIVQAVNSTLDGCPAARLAGVRVRATGKLARGSVILISASRPAEGQSAPARRKADLSGLISTTIGSIDFA
jgi:hypothetical protein